MWTTQSDCVQLVNMNFKPTSAREHTLGKKSVQQAVIKLHPRVWPALHRCDLPHTSLPDCKWLGAVCFFHISHLVNRVVIRWQFNSCLTNNIWGNWVVWWSTFAYFPWSLILWFCQLASVGFRGCVRQLIQPLMLAAWQVGMTHINATGYWKSQLINICDKSPLASGFLLTL